MRVHEDEDPDEENLPVSNNGNETQSISMRHLKENKPQSRTCLRYLVPSGKASGTWSLRKDGTRALLECARALIGVSIAGSVPYLPKQLHNIFMACGIVGLHDSIRKARNGVDFKLNYYIHSDREF